MELPNTIDKLFPVKAEASFWWSLLAPGTCKCGQIFERDATMLVRHEKSGKLGVKCPHCSNVSIFSLSG